MFDESHPLSSRFCSATLLIVIALGATARAQSDSFYEQEPIRYSAPDVNDPVARLQKRLDSGEVKLNYEDAHGYLRSVLELLEVPVSSQMLVFSKTSFQRDRISPESPRAVYFNDSVYVGSVQLGEVVEVSAVDPQKGAIFYTLAQQPVERPVLRRQTHDCLQCHDSSLSLGVPGHIVRSVFPDTNGQPILSAGTFVTNHNSPLSERWGGWYVTGTHGKQTHMGNVNVARPAHHEPPPKLEFTAGVNVTDLAGRCDVAPYLSPHSDIVALMVLEHQTHLHNLITRANYQTRLALRDEGAMNRALGRPADERLDSTMSRVKSVCEPLVRYMLFAEEAPLTNRVEGTSGFAREFAARGPRDRQGRSLRDFDLEKRIFRNPLSYLIYSEAFDSLPDLARDYIYRRLWQVLSGEDKSDKFGRLNEADRRAIVEIVRETKPGLPEYWTRQD
jgi:hypothetical protein